MPFAGFENFDACLTDEEMRKRSPDEETRRKVCGSLQAKAEKEQSGPYVITYAEVRELRIELFSGKYQEQDGGLLIRDVKLLASGTWTDLHIGTPLFYPGKVLEKYAKNWIDNSLWSRHSGGMSRSITDKIGEVRALQAQVSEAKKSDITALEAQLEEAKKHQTSNLSAELFGANQKIAELVRMTYHS